MRTTSGVIDDPPGSSPSPVINDAKFPEWQCALPTELLPTQCGLQILADGNKFFGNWGADKKEGNASKITDSSQRQKPTLRQSERLSPQELARKRAIAATGKFDNEADDERGSLNFDPPGVDASRSGDKLTQENCDNKIAELFGGEGAVVATAIDPVSMTATNELVNGKLIYTNKVLETVHDYSRHLANNGTFHIYPDKFGTDSLEVGLFVPKGAKVLKLAGERVQDGGGITNTFGFYFESGEYKGVDIWFDHVGGTYGGKEEGQNLGKEFLRKTKNGGVLIGPTNPAGSQQVGYIGGPGGRQDANIYKNPLYRHTHVTVKRNGRKTDPRKVFCGW